MKILGLDEAGRGCVLGALVVGAFCCEESQLEAVKNSGATDSKKLSAKKRQKILAKLPALGDTRQISITPAQIDAGNINTLEEEAFVAHILYYKPDCVYIDSPCHPAGIPNLVKRFDLLLGPHLGGKLPKFIIEPKADLTYPIVGAASIVAKVLRDAQLKLIDGEVGSGYPSDPKTRNWLKGFIERDEPFPDCVRTRWATIDNLRQQVLFPSSK
jgi:ribonuclease HII